MAAPLPAKIVEKGKLSNAVVVDVILKKYRDHTPLYRQSAIPGPRLRGGNPAGPRFATA